MEKFGYLWISVLLFFPWIFLFLFNKNLRKRMVLCGIMCIPFGALNLWFKQDYWNAPEVFIFFSVISLDDILFAFITTGISVALYDAFFTEEQIKLEKNRINNIGFAFLFVLISWYLLREIIGINSMFMFAIPLILVTIVFLFIRRDLIIPSIITTIAFTTLAAVTYSILFNYFLPSFWSTYWYLWENQYGWTVFGNVPVLELLWYFSWGSLSAILYDFGKGTKKIPNKLGKIFIK